MAALNHRPIRMTSIAISLVAIMFCMSRSGAAAAPLPLEYAVKASYLYKFAPFVEWPPQAFAAAAHPLTICLTGEDPFGTALDDAVRGQTVGGHPIATRRLAPGSSLAGCHILFVGRAAGDSPATILAGVAGQPVLTVTDRSRGVEGGMIEFVMRDGHVRFAIDAAAAQASGITISSKLLALALTPGKR